jgi:hypothetical protein
MQAKHELNTMRSATHEATEARRRELSGTGTLPEQPYWPVGESPPTQEAPGLTSTPEPSCQAISTATSTTHSSPSLTREELNAMADVARTRDMLNAWDGDEHACPVCLHIYRHTDSFCRLTHRHMVHISCCEAVHASYLRESSEPAREARLAQGLPGTPPESICTISSMGIYCTTSNMDTTTPDGRYGRKSSTGL